QLGELVTAADGEGAADRLLVGSEDVDTEVPGLPQPRPAARPAVGHEGDQRRVERHRGERPDREPGGLTVGVHPRDDSDAGRKVTEDLAEQPRLDAAAHARTSASANETARRSTLRTLPE